MKAILTIFWACAVAITAATVPASAQQNDVCAGVTTRTLTYSPTGYGADQFAEQLAQLHGQMQGSPACKVVVVGGGGGSKFEQQMSWQRVDAIISYMNETHDMSRSRFIFLFGQEGDANTVVIRAAAEGEDGPSSPPPPHPNLRR